MNHLLKPFLTSLLLRYSPLNRARWSLAMVFVGWMLCPSVYAQEVADVQKVRNTVYVCEQGGTTTLRNTQPLAGASSCTVKTITVNTMMAQVEVAQRRAGWPTVRPAIESGIPIYPRAWDDPQPTAHTLIIGAQIPPNIQWQRDLGRQRIVQAELIAAEQRLAALKAEYHDGEPERLGSEKNYQKYLDRVADLKQNIRRVEDNIAALRRELNTIGAMP